MKNEEFNEIRNTIIITSIMLYLLIAVLFMSVERKIDKIENKIDTIGTVIEATDCKF